MTATKTTVADRLTSMAASKSQLSVAKRSPPCLRGAERALERPDQGGPKALARRDRAATVRGRPYATARILQLIALAAIVAVALPASGTAALPLRGGPTYAMIVRVLDETAGKYEVEVQNVNQASFIAGFNWTPPSGLSITEITGATGGKCLLAADGTVACKGQAAPSTTGQGVGESLIVDFTATGDQPIWTGSFWIHQGVVGSVKVQTSTFSDLPLCKKGQHNKKASPCTSA